MQFFRISFLTGLVTVFLFACTPDPVAQKEILVTPPNKNLLYIENKHCLDVTHTRVHCY